MSIYSGSGTVKKAVPIKIRGKQAFKAKKTEVDPEINKLATSSFQGEVKSASSDADTIENISVADKVEIKSDIRESIDTFPKEEIEGIQKVVKEAEENSNYKKRVTELENELGKMTARYEKASENLIKFALIADKLLEDLSEEDIKIFMQTDDAEFYRNIVKKTKKTV